ncbi:acetate/propionate family kinase [Horticoccus sp. 23ND18S-11]|uniref:acetate/propionate family kinase n=1 Tax=Horticoccus sp. 23ND18S-11 TaxID=3391832 RepID=UPI0039C9CDC3
MNILVANLGSTSFKFRLFRFDGADHASLLAKGGYERVTDYGKAIDDCLGELQAAGHVRSAADLHGVGFKTVLGRDLTGCVPADEKVIAALDGFREIAPAHNPPYALGIQRFREKLPGVPLVALFETAFYQWVPEASSRYAVPQTWYDAGVRRYGFHGASHKFAAERSAELLGRADVVQRVQQLYQSGPTPLAAGAKALRVISCHLGGSSSVTGIRDGVAIGTSMGLSPQSGLPQNNRVGDLDSAAVPFVMKTLGLSLAEAERQMTKESGLLGLSGVGNDLRDVRAAAQQGNARAQLALDVFVQSTRHWIGAFLVELGGCDALVFTAGIGENNPDLRAAICANLSDLGLVLDAAKNNAVRGTEGEISAATSRVKVFVIPANEELVVARETVRCITAKY